VKFVSKYFNFAILSNETGWITSGTFILWYHLPGRTTMRSRSTFVACCRPVGMLLCTLHCHTELDCTATLVFVTAALLKALALLDVMLCRLESKLLTYWTTVQSKRL
jgi:hypothetical protein